MTILDGWETDILLKQIEEDLKNPVGFVPTPKIHLVAEKIRKEIKETFTKANEYDVEKIKRKLDMFLKTNNLQYLEKVLYLTKELIKERIMK